MQPCPIFIVKVVPLIHGHEVNHRAFWQIHRFVEHQVPILHRCSQCVCHAQRLPRDKGQRAKAKAGLGAEGERLDLDRGDIGGGNCVLGGDDDPLDVDGGWLGIDRGGTIRNPTPLWVSRSVWYQPTR